MEEDGFQNGWVNRIGMDDLARLQHVSSDARLVFLRVCFKLDYRTAPHLFTASYGFYDLASFSISITNDFLDEL